MITNPAGTAEALRISLASSLEVTRPSGQGFARPPGESLGLPPLDGDFVERCRTAVNRLVGLEDRGVIAITSAHRKEGRSSVAAGVATALTRTRGTGGVLLVDLDFERPAQAELLSVAPAPGVADFIEGRSRLRVVLGGPGRQLALMPAGQPEVGPAQLLHRLIREEIIAVLRERFQWVVLDLPPLDRNPEVAQLANQADWQIVVGWHRRSTVNELREVQEHLLVKGRIGFLLTGDSSRIPNRIRRLL